MTYEHEVTTHRPACSWSNVSAGQRGTGEKGLLFPKEVFTLVHWLVGWLVWTDFHKTGMDDGPLPRTDPINFWCFPDKGKDRGIYFNIPSFPTFFADFSGNNAWTLKKNIRCTKVAGNIWASAIRSRAYIWWSQILVKKLLYVWYKIYRAIEFDIGVGLIEWSGLFGIGRGICSA